VSRLFLDEKETLRKCPELFFTADLMSCGSSHFRKTITNHGDNAGNPFCFTTITSSLSLRNFFRLVGSNIRKQVNRSKTNINGIALGHAAKDRRFCD